MDYIEFIDALQEFLVVEPMRNQEEDAQRNMKLKVYSIVIGINDVLEECLKHEKDMPKSVIEQIERLNKKISLRW